MAVVTTTITPAILLEPFTGYTEPFSEQTGRARAEVISFIRDAAVALSGVGDNQLININVDLPQNFAYAVTDIAVNILASTGNDVNFADQISCFFFDATVAADRTRDIPIRLNSLGEFQSGSANKGGKVYVSATGYSGVVVPVPGKQPRLQVSSFNETANDGAYTVDVNMRFLQYDISQAHHFAVNSNIPTR